MGDEQGQGSLNRPVFFLDENHCRNTHVIAAIEQAGFTCEKHLDHFPAGIEDLLWLPVIAAFGWCLVTTDARIRSNFLEKESVRVHGLRMFYFAKNNLAGRDMGVALHIALPAMERLVQRQQPPFTASISKRGDVTLRDIFDMPKSNLSLL